MEFSQTFYKVQNNMVTLAEVRSKYFDVAKRFVLIDWKLSSVLNLLSVKFT